MNTPDFDKNLSEVETYTNKNMDYTIKYALNANGKQFGEFVRHKGKCWFNPNNPLDNRGAMSLWSLKSDGTGITANPKEVYDCTMEECDAIKYFQGRTRRPPIT